MREDGLFPLCALCPSVRHETNDRSGLLDGLGYTLLQGALEKHFRTLRNCWNLDATVWVDVANWLELTNTETRFQGIWI